MVDANTPSARAGTDEPAARLVRLYRGSVNEFACGMAARAVGEVEIIPLDIALVDGEPADDGAVTGPRSLGVVVDIDDGEAVRAAFQLLTDGAHTGPLAVAAAVKPPPAAPARRSLTDQAARLARAARRRWPWALIAGALAATGLGALAWLAFNNLAAALLVVIYSLVAVAALAVGGWWLKRSFDRVRWTAAASGRVQAETTAALLALREQVEHLGPGGAPEATKS